MTDTNHWYECEMRLRAIQRKNKRHNYILTATCMVLVVLWVTMMMYAVVSIPKQDEARITKRLIEIGAIAAPVEVKGQY